MEYSSRPSAVTVYRQGAVVERRIRVEKPQSGRVVLPGLPLSLIDGSVSVQALPAEGARVSSASVRLHARPRSDAPEAPAHTELEQAREELERARRRQQRLQAELELLSEIPLPQRPEAVPGQPPPPSPLQARIAFDAFLDGETRERHEALAQARDRIEELEDTIADLLDRIRRHEGAKQARPDELSKAVHLDLSIHGEGPVELVVRYRVPSCRWVPRYGLSIHGDRATLELRAAVAQDSGEDWQGVHLTLSTAEPLAYCALPRLAAARIGKEQPPPARRPPRPAPQGAQALFEDFDRARSHLPGPARPRRRHAPRTELHDLSDAFEGAAPVVFASALGGASAGVPSDALRDEAVPMPPPALERAAPAPKAAMPPGARKRKARPAPARTVIADAEADDLMMEEAEEPSRPELRWPDYHTMVLPPTTDGRRGHLVPVSTEERLAHVLTDAGIELPFDVGQLLDQHEKRARAVSRLSLPAHARDVRPSHFDHAVRAAHPVDVPSLGTWHTVTVAEHEAGCQVRYIGVPREEASMYRIATLPNPCGHPLLAGPVEVSVAGTYILTTTLPHTGSGEDLELGVGVEPSLHVARNTRFDDQRSDERVVAMRELHHHIDIDIRNDLGKAVDVELRERIPVPDGEAEVAVDVVEVDPEWAPYDQHERGAKLEGGHRWRAEVPARSKKTFSAHYVVRLYANNELVGGDRREA